MCAVQNEIAFDKDWFDVRIVVEAVAQAFGRERMEEREIDAVVLVIIQLVAKNVFACRNGGGEVRLGVLNIKIALPKLQFFAVEGNPAVFFFFHHQGQRHRIANREGLLDPYRSAVIGTQQILEDALQG